MTALLNMELTELSLLFQSYQYSTNAGCVLNLLFSVAKDAPFAQMATFATVAINYAKKQELKMLTTTSP